MPTRFVNIAALLVLMALSLPSYGQVIQGTINLLKWENEEAIDLTGEWYSRPGVISPENWFSSPKDAKLFLVKNRGRFAAPSKRGVQTLTIDLENLPPKKQLVLQFRNRGAYNVFFGPKGGPLEEIGSQGIISRKNRKIVSRSGERSFALTTHLGGVYTLLVQSRDFGHGGLARAPVLYKGEAYSKKSFGSLIHESFLGCGTSHCFLFPSEFYPKKK